MTGQRITKLVAVLAMIWVGLVSGAAAQEVEPDIYPMVFPVAGGANYSDSWGAPRSEGRTHHGNDLFAAKGTPVLAVAPGTVVRITVGERAGRYIIVEHFDGWRSYYIHLDNDTPGTDDGLGGAPAAGITVGARVEAGQVLDYVGDSGNAEGTPPHLHFELHEPNGDPIDPYPHLRAAETGDAVFTARPTRAAPRGPETLNTLIVGSYNPGGGFTAGIAAHNNTAYLGSWGRPGVCPGTGVRLVDVTDPSKPAELGAIATGDEFPGTSTDSVWVGAVDNENFTGDLAVVAVRRCDNTESGRYESGFRGMALYDVTNPQRPKRLSKLATGGITQGVHELDVAIRDDGAVLIAATVMQSLPHTDGRRGDVRIVDATDPRHPAEVANWDIRRDAPEDLRVDIGATLDVEEFHAHGVTFAHGGEWLWVAHWDAGAVLLDIADPAEPDFVTATGFDPESEGNAHSIAFDDARGLLIRTDEDLFPSDTASHVDGWGAQRLYRVAQSGKVTEISTFDGADRLDVATDEEQAGEDAIPLDGFYSAHEAVIVDDIEYVAWYSSGLRIVDISDPRKPSEIGYFVPPPRKDPTGHWDAPDGSDAFPMVWGVAVVDDLIYVSDINSGLWIIRFDDGLSDELVDPGPTDWSPVR